MKPKTKTDFDDCRKPNIRKLTSDIDRGRPAGEDSNLFREFQTVPGPSSDSFSSGNQDELCKRLQSKNEEKQVRNDTNKFDVESVAIIEKLLK